MRYEESSLTLPLGLIVVMICILIEIYSVTLPYVTYGKVDVYIKEDIWMLFMMLLSISLSICSILLGCKGVNPTPLIVLSASTDLLNALYVLTSIRYYIMLGPGFMFTITSALLKGAACLMITLNVGELEVKIIEKIEELEPGERF